MTLLPHLGQKTAGWSICKSKPTLGTNLNKAPLHARSPRFPMTPGQRKVAVRGSAPPAPPRRSTEIPLEVIKYVEPGQAVGGASYHCR